MALQTQNFLGAAAPKSDHSGVTDALSNYLKGYGGAMAPEKMQEEQRKLALTNALSQLELENKPEDYETQFDLRRGQMQHYKDMANGKTFAPSTLGKLIQERNEIAARNPNDPLLAEYDRVIKSQGGSKGYAPTNLGKLLGELQQVQEGFMPGSNGTIPLDPERQEKLTQDYLLQIQKTNTDAGTRTTVLQGQNLLKSINASNIDSLTRYSGPAGAAKLKLDQARDLAGKPSKAYLEHLEALQAVRLEAKELRQFFGDSITPAASDALYEMVNATSLTKSPEAAKRMIQKSRDTIKKQVKTFEDALKTTNAYSSGGNSGGVPNNFSAAIKNAQNPPKLFGNLQLEDDGGQ